MGAKLGQEKEEEVTLNEKWTKDLYRASQNMAVRVFFWTIR